MTQDYLSRAAGRGLTADSGRDLLHLAAGFQEFCDVLLKVIAARHRCAFLCFGCHNCLLLNFTIGRPLYTKYRAAAKSRLWREDSCDANSQRVTECSRLMFGRRAVQMPAGGYS